MLIESKENKIYKELTALKSKKHRRIRQQFLAEGENFINEIPEGHIEKYVVSESYYNQYLSITPVTEKKTVIILKDFLFEKLSDTESPQGRIALCKMPSYSLDELLDLKNPFFIAAQNLQDPGNLGTIIRTAYAAGATAVFLSQGSVEVYNPKVIRSSAGAIFHIPVVECTDFESLIPRFKEKGINVIATTVSAKITPYEIDFLKPSAILIGNESKGLQNTDYADQLVSIPMPGGAESLNASVACSILIYEYVRQKIIV